MLCSDISAPTIVKIIPDCDPIRLYYHTVSLSLWLAHVAVRVTTHQYQVMSGRQVAIAIYSTA